MSTNMTLIETKTAGSGGVSSFDFTSIPQTYTDLVVVTSLRCTNTSSNAVYLTFNGSGSSYDLRYIVGTGSATASGIGSSIISRMVPSDATANTFSNSSAYIPNYTSSNYKSVSTDSVAENNATSALMNLDAELWSNTAAINRITITPASGGDIAQYSTASLYGISNVTSTTKATGGIVSSDGTYNYHMFPYSGTFTPTTAISADYLVIAGGGGGWVGGGGAGGYRTSIGGTALSLTAQAYSVTVGAGGAPQGTSGSNSVFSTITSTGGGAGAGGVTVYNGGSGGGGSNDATNYGTGNAGGYSPSEGNNGGSRVSSTTSGGGGGAGAVGNNASGTTGGAGGNGSNSASTWATATQTGVNGYYAGGGGGGGVGGGALGSSGGGLGGLGGGGNAESAGVAGRPGQVNTGSGGGGQYYVASQGNGGSGLVIIRYAI